MRFCLGIEIGGTKLQIGLGDGRAPRFEAFWRGLVDPQAGSAPIRRQIVEGISQLLTESGIPREQIAGLGIAFGGPVDAGRGTTVISHQVPGWEQFPLVEWAERELGFRTLLQNDADSAALAEARFGAGRGFDPVLYVTVGSGIGGGLILGGQIFRGSGAGAMEIGHLRPGNLPRQMPESGLTVEAVASGFGVAERARRTIENWENTAAFMQTQFRDTSPHRTSVDPVFQRGHSAQTARFARLLDLAGGDPARITTNLIATAAAAGDALSLEILSDATSCIGWALAQAATLINPARIVVGGGVSLIGEELFFGPVRRAFQSQVFPPFAGIAAIVPAELGEEVVVHGAVAIAGQAFLDRQQRGVSA